MTDPIADMLTRVRNSSRKEEILTSALSITEVAFGAEEQLGHPLDPAAEERINALWDDPSVIKIREFDRLIGPSSPCSRGRQIRAGH